MHRAIVIIGAGLVVVLQPALDTWCRTRSPAAGRPGALSFAAEAANLTAATPEQCASLTDGVKIRIESMKALTASLKSSQNAAPTSLSRALLDPPSGGEGDVEKNLREERRTIDDLNSMLAANMCARVDVDFELTQPAKTIPPPAHAEKIHGHHKK